MVGRKGFVFNPDAFEYDEIIDITDQIKTLFSHGLVGPIDADNYEYFLTHLTKAKLLVFLSTHSGADSFKIS